ncbi:uncharacterized protein LOC134949685 [Pseudophryne corroboree]|uniref:uncharacterized protein LOC134949685 n=1 Tax=Pseudophryne corroboree TaxID=495146 RepID=UPI003081652D
MESQPLLESQGAEKNARFWVCVRRALLLLFWVSLALMTGAAILLLVRAYEPPPRTAWYQRSVLCYTTGPQPSNLTELRRRIEEVSALGCGGLILAWDNVTERNLRSLVAEGRWHNLHIMLELQLLDEYNVQQIQDLGDAARSWIDDGASGFRLSGGQREAVITVSDILREELENVTGEERLILLPDWLCADTAINKSQIFHTCPFPDWNLQDAPGRSEVVQTAWEVSPGDNDSLGMRQFMAVTQPGTVILSLSQSQPPPSWLRSLLFLRFHNPALYAGWLQDLSNNSSYIVLRHWGCSTLLVVIGRSASQENVSLHIPNYAPSAQLLLSTIGRSSRGQLMVDTVLLAAGEAQLLRLSHEEL